VIFAVVYLLVRRLLGGLMVLARREASKDAELLVLRRENAVLRRQISRVRYQPGGRLWLAALSQLVPQAPRANAICERIIGTLRRELFDQLLILNEDHLRRVLTEYLRHYNTARPHRALSQLTPAQAETRPPEPVNLANYRIRRTQILGGLTHEYYVAALPPTPRRKNAGHTLNRISEPHR
jgi:hypothetical protein